ncbi:FAD-dependent oxidoreductase [Agarivorans sp. B2Z047]|uniref:NAD(P)/FAD-dependent oxidoreductase n=1 Tax=Agarivorans sp. B2Z047 TaxID=2652721 RepID=UPI00128C4F7D|nr:FAD-dependent oxidoreductase [Agarivorans sp. B2Z047]MPW27875.1 FAD-dependent oxidoreductase [Agarivorans sp. B2Z047]UQN44290.1 FAD-dependent oxidoreductase [Agarivorans sp. B2Z047]
MKIAIIGAGISGMTCAHLLKEQHEVTLLEQNDYLGGHTATNQVTIEGKEHAVDTGFIVFNDRTYPLFNKLLAKLGIQAQETEMSFSVVNPELNLQYNGHDLNTLFAQRSNLLKPSFYKFINEILRFNKLAKAAVDIDTAVSLGLFLEQHRFSRMFQENYLLPMGAAIWSSSLNGIMQFPMQFFARFFVNHGLLDVANRPQWYVIPGGSKQYIKPLLAGLDEHIRLNSQVSSIHRDDSGVNITTSDGWQWQGDAVIFACHSDQALSALGAQASDDERSVLGKLKYQNNEVILHTDERLLPSIHRARASWNYLLPPSGDRGDRLASVTYDMNRLQGLSDAPQFCVTLNPLEPIAEDKVIKRFNYMHPVFSIDGHQAQQQRDNICGHNNSYFCGAYWHNGFHEDGVRSAVEVCRKFGVDL